TRAVLRGLSATVFWLRLSVQRRPFLQARSSVQFRPSVQRHSPIQRRPSVQRCDAWVVSGRRAARQSGREWLGARLVFTCSAGFCAVALAACTTVQEDQGREDSVLAFAEP